MSDAHAHSHAPGHAHDGHDAHDVKKHIKTYILVFLSLLVGTVITVGLYYVHFESVAVTVAVALFIASVKALLVAGFFMHLISEKKAIYSTLAITFFFFAAMMYLTIWSRGEVPRGTEYFATKHVPLPMSTTPAK